MRYGLVLVLMGLALTAVLLFRVGEDVPVDPGQEITSESGPATTASDGRTTRQAPPTRQSKQEDAPLQEQEVATSAPRMSGVSRAFWSNPRVDEAIEAAWEQAQAGDLAARFHVAIGVELCLRRLTLRENSNVEPSGHEPCPDFDRAAVARYADAAGFIQEAIEREYAPALLWVKSRGMGSVDRLTRSIADVLEEREEIRFAHQAEDRTWETPDPARVRELMREAGPEGLSWGIQALSRGQHLNDDWASRAPLMALTGHCALGAECGPGSAAWESLCGPGDLSCREDRSLEENLEMVLGPERWRQYRDQRQALREMVRDGDYSRLTDGRP